MRLLAGKPQPPPEREDLLAKRMPMDFLREELTNLTDHAMAARRHGGDRWKAAAEVFRELPDLLPSKHVPNNTMSPAEQQAFGDGYAQQRIAYREKYGPLVDGRRGPRPSDGAPS